MAHGLIRASFVPDEPTQQMRDLLRTRKQMVRERSGHIQRIQKTLEDANIKLDSVVTDILGLSGRRIIEALIAGQTVPQALATLAHRRGHASLSGRVTAHHRFLLKLHLDQIDAVPSSVSDRGPAAHLPLPPSGVFIAASVDEKSDLLPASHSPAGKGQADQIR
jgi:transposase